MMYNMVDNRSNETMDDMERKWPKETNNFSEKIEKTPLHLSGKVVSFRRRRRAATRGHERAEAEYMKRGLHYGN